MRGLQKSKRVSWASDLSLCQVKLFLSDESPSQVGLVGQDHLQAKDSWSWHSGGSSSDDNLPPGFEGIQPASFLQNKLSQIPLIQWKCPTRFILDSTWQVAAGEESKELEVETQREMRVLEAVYPRPSAVPPNPASTMGNDESYYNDQHTPIIPITPIEDEDTAPDTSSSSSSSTNVMPPPAVVPGVEPDVVAALSAAMSGTAPGNLIDQSLLIKLLSNPGLIEKLVSTHAPSTSSQQISQLGQQISQPPPVPATFSPPISLPDPPLPVHTRPTHHPFSTPSSSGTHYPPPSRVGPVPVPVHVSVPAPVSAPNLQPPQPPPQEVNPLGKKDLNYYKSLIQQHGGDKPEGVNNNNQKTRDVKQKSMKACIYFNSARGCRHGANCVFQHERANNSLQETQSAKRMKMDREITGT